MVLLAVIVIVTVSAAFLSIDTGLLAQSAQGSAVRLNLVESCVNEVLLELNETAAVPSTVTLPQGTCSVVLNSQTGQTWDVTVTSISGSNTEAIQVTADRGNTVARSSWQRIAQ